MSHKNALKECARWVMAKVPARIIRSVPSHLGRRRLLAICAGAVQVYPRAFRTRTPEGLVFQGHTSDVIQRMVYVYGVWEPEISAWVKGFLRPGDSVLDVGANWGFFSVWASACVGSRGAVVALEPVPIIFDSLIQNVSLNGLTNVVPKNVVLSDKNGSVEMFLATSENIGNSATFAEPGFTSVGQVRAVCGDDMGLEGFEPIRLIKVDTEGDEYRVLCGLKRTLNRMTPGGAVLVEITPDKLSLRGHQASDVWSLFPLSDWDRYTIVNNYSETSYAMTRFEAPSAVSEVPKERVDMIFLRK